MKSRLFGLSYAGGRRRVYSVCCCSARIIRGLTILMACENTSHKNQHWYHLFQIPQKRNMFRTPVSLSDLPHKSKTIESQLC